MATLSAARPGMRAMFLADWRDALFIHFAVDPAILQPMVALPLDVYEGRAYVSLVAFTQDRLRPAIHCKAAEFVSRPLARHEFLNLRTYVIHQNEPGIFFLAEWIPNALAVFLGPRLYGLPYKLADLRYETAPGLAVRRVVAEGEFCCRAEWNPAELPAPAEAGSETEFLVERYCAYTLRGRTLRRFRISHAPWGQIRADITILRRDLIDGIPITTPRSAHYSPGLRGIRISPPARISPIMFPVPCPNIR